MNPTLLYIPEIFGFSIEVYFILLLIAIPTFYFCRFVLKKYIKLEKRRKTTTWIATLVVTPILYILFVSLWFFGLPDLTEHPSMKFDKAKWQIYDDMEYPFRRAMLQDLTNNYKLTGLSYKELVNLIGEEQKNLIGDSGVIYYPVFVDYGHDIDPVHTIDLAIRLNKDSVVTGFHIDEWKK